MKANFPGASILRKRFQLDTRLHRQIGRLVHRVIARWMARQIGCHRNRREERNLVSDVVYFPDGNYFALGFWDQPSLLSELRHSILKSLVARNCLQPETGVDGCT